MGTRISALVRMKKIGKYEDAKTPIFIEVTAMDVARAQCFAPDQCALAKAACRAHPNTFKAFFYKNGVYIALWDPKKNRKGKTLRYMPSREAARAIDVFDQTGKFTPGKYRLDAPTGSYTLKDINERNKRRPGRHKPGKTNIKRRVRVETKARIQFALA